MASSEPNTTSANVSSNARQAIDAIARTARKEIEGLDRNDALDVLDIAREELLQLAAETHGGMSVGDSPD
jgi:hypothetical protein